MEPDPNEPPSAEGKPGGSRTAGLGFIFVTLFLDILGIGIIVPVLADLVQQLDGGTEADAAPVYGWLVAVYCLMQFVCAPLLGALSDQMGRRKVILVALFGAGLDYFLLAWAPTLAWFFVGRVVAGMTGANFSAATAYIADVSPPEKRAANFGLVGAAFGLGFIAGPWLGGVLGQIDLRLPFVVAGCLTMVNWLYGLLVLPESLPPEKRRRFSWAEANPLASLKGLSRSPLILRLAVAVFLFNIGHYVYQSVWVLFTGSRFGWGPSENGWSLALVGVMAVVVQGWLGRKYLIPMWGERKTVIIGLTVLAFEMVGFGFASEPWHIYVLILFGSVGGLASPAIQGLMSRSVSDDEQGWLNGAFTSLSSLAGSFAPVVLTEVFHFFNGNDREHPVPGAPFFLSALLMVAAALVTLGCLREVPEKTEP